MPPGPFRCALSHFHEEGGLTTPPFSAMLFGMGYPGGKNAAGVYQKIINLMPPHQVYIEPFLGGGAIMRLKRPAKGNIGLDLEPSVISAWRARLAGTDDARETSDPTIAAELAGNGEARRHRSPETAMVATAADFGDAQSLNVETGDGPPASEIAILPAASPEPALRSASSELARVDVASFHFECRDGIDFLARSIRVPHYRFSPDTLVYCDPPYLLSTRGNRRIYRYELSDRQHRRLLKIIKRLPCMVMISGYWSEMYASALKGWNSISFEAMTRGGRKATEWLWYNFPEPVALHDYRFLGKNFRERERIKRKKQRWVNRLERMPLLERRALLSAIADTPGFDDGGSNRRI